MEVAINQGDGCCIPIHVHNQSGDGFNTYFIAGVQAPVSGDHLIFSVLYKPDYHGGQHTLGPDAFDQLVHFLIEVDVSDKEYELLKQCCRDDEEIDGYEGLEDLYERIVEYAKDESECCEPDDCEDIDYDDAYYTVAMPQVIYDEVQEEY